MNLDSTDLGTAIDVGALNKLKQRLKKIASWKTLKKLLRGSMTIAFTAYFFGISIPNEISIPESIVEINKNRSLAVVYFIILYFAIEFFFNNFLEYVLRFCFHGYIKEKITNTILTLSKNDFETKRINIESAKIVSKVIYRFFIRTGNTHSSIFNTPLDLTKFDIEKDFNDEMKIFYTWITLGIQSFITIIVVWRFYAWWFILSLIVLLVVSIILNAIKMFIILNPSYLELIRAMIERDNRKKNNLTERSNRY